MKTTTTQEERVQKMTAGAMQDHADDAVDDGFLGVLTPAAVVAEPRFKLGRTVSTPGAMAALEAAGQNGAYFLERHVRLEPGDLEDYDREANEDAVTDGARILSTYRTDLDTRIWIITEADRSSTCLLLPEEY